MAPGWGVSDIPSQAGRTIVVTGANGGLGYETARALARAGGRVVLACRDPGKGGRAADRIRAESRDVLVETLPLDLASLGSVRAFARAFSNSHERLDVLVNNAGVMGIRRSTTADGFEMQMGTNHLGHFALCGLLLEKLLAADGARVVTVSSTAHRIGRIQLDDLQGERSYSRWGAYAQSKLANLLFAYELQRRLAAAGRTQSSVACHPGWAATNLQFVAARLESSRSMEYAASFANRLLSQDAASGALPILYAATAAGVRGGDYVGPSGPLELWGPPRVVGSSRRSHDADLARRLWQTSEEITGVRYDALGRS